MLVLVGLFTEDTILSNSFLDRCGIVTIQRFFGKMKIIDKFCKETIAKNVVNFCAEMLYDEELNFEIKTLATRLWDKDGFELDCASLLRRYELIDANGSLRTNYSCRNE